MPSKEQTAKEVASKRQPLQATGLSISRTTKAKILLKAALLTSIVGFTSKITQLNLSPVYGQIPTALYHSNLIVFFVILAHIARRSLKSSPNNDYQYLIAPWMYWILPIQFTLFGYSETFGPVWGPMLTQVVTFFPVLVLTLLTAGFAIDELGLHARYGGDPRVVDGVPAVATFTVFTLAEWAAEWVLPRVIGTHDFLTRTGMQLIAATGTAALTRSKLLAFAVPAMIHTLMSNPHHYALGTTKMVNGTLYDWQYGVVDRRDSVTGYISVIHNKKDQWLAMRCDHSMLGGEWLVTPKRRKEGIEQRETIYAVFTMLEGVRLVKKEIEEPDDEKDALFIGLGVGTAPKALITHGINTTIVELDPVIHDFATKYFDLPPNHNKVIANAVPWVAETSKHQPESFDYIVHDVFTGGAEPVDLFTYEFLSGLSTLLKEDGTIAINYAGDITAPAPRYVLNTIFKVFPTCRIYRDTIPSASPETFLNMVVYCVKSERPIEWRLTRNEDYLGSLSRRAHLPPDEGNELKLEEVGGKTRWFNSEEKEWSEDDWISVSNTSVVEAFRKEGAVRHWEIMRTVIPAKVWETW